MAVKPLPRSLSWAHFLRELQAHFFSNQQRLLWTKSAKMLKIAMIYIFSHQISSKCVFLKKNRGKPVNILERFQAQSHYLHSLYNMGRSRYLPTGPKQLSSMGVGIGLYFRFTVIVLPASNQHVPITPNALAERFRVYFHIAGYH